MKRKLVGIAVSAVFSVTSHLHGHSALQTIAYCQDRDSLEELAKNAKTDRVLSGLRVTVEREGREQRDNIKFGAFVEAGKIPSTERGAYCHEMNEARKSGEVFVSDLRSSKDFGLVLRHLRPTAILSSPDPKRPFTLIISSRPQSDFVEVSNVNKLYGGKYDKVGILTTTALSHPESGSSEAMHVMDRELLCHVLEAQSGEIDL
jgi:hypothetical protein